MTHTILVTAPTLAKEGAEFLAQAGSRVIYLADADSPKEVERIMVALTGSQKLAAATSATSGLRHRHSTRLSSRLTP
jgi:hypothetical protein